MSRIVQHIPAGASMGWVSSFRQRAEQLGLRFSDCVVGSNWSEIAGTLSAGDVLVVDSLTCFTSLNELLGFVASNGVRVRSLSEGWFSEPIEDPSEYQQKLYALGSSLHARRTQQGLAQAAIEGRKPGRRQGSKGKGSTSVQLQGLVDRVDALRKDQRFSTVEACRQVGISTPVYYYNKRKQLDQEASGGLGVSARGER